MSPVLKQPPPKEYVCLSDDPAFASVDFVDLPYAASSSVFVGQTAKLVRVLSAVLDQVDILHTGVAGWPFPYGWLAIPLAKRKNKPVVVLVESAFWRTSGKESPTLKQRLRGLVSERLNRLCVNAADLAIFTQPEYRDALLTRPGKQGHVIQASWIDTDQILETDRAAKAWEDKLSDPEAPLRLLFAGRLLPEKGVKVLLDTALLLQERGLRAEITIIGEGDLKAECREAAERLQDTVRLLVRDPIPYEGGFMDLLGEQHAVLVPGISDEQPRIVYDAYSQAVPVLASRTAGLEACVTDKQTGRLVTPGAPGALAEMIQWASANRQNLRVMGIRALERARQFTHETMHQRRHELILEMLNG